MSGYEEFFSEHYDEVVRTLTLATGDRGRAEDAAQEAFAVSVQGSSRDDGLRVANSLTELDDEAWAAYTASATGIADDLSSISPAEENVSTTTAGRSADDEPSEEPATSAPQN